MPIKLLIVFRSNINTVLSFLDINDIAKLSILCKATNSLVLKKELCNHLFISRIPNSVPLNIMDDLYFDQFRKLLSHLMRKQSVNIKLGKDFQMYVDFGDLKINPSLRVDLSQITEKFADLPDTVAEEEKIQKFLELSSFDDFDDFQPRHPQPKDRSHRRGDSYFNSDISAIVDTKTVFDLSNLQVDKNLVMDADEY